MDIKKKAVKDISLVMFSNIIAILAGFVTGFLIPKIFSVEDYGYYKTFTLYTGYLGLLNLGIADGIVLKFGGYDYNELDREKFRAYFRWFELVHLILCGAMVVGGFFLRGESGFILAALGVNTMIINTVSYFQQISQITQRFKEFSMRKIIQATSGLAIAGIVILLNRMNGGVGYRLYLILNIVFSFALSFWYLSTYRQIVFGRAPSLWDTRDEVMGFIRSGFPLLFANLCSTLILTLDRQFVNVLFNKTEYAVYAFAYSMLSLVTVATSAASTVLFPALKRTSTENLRGSYSKLIGVMLVFVFGAMLGYYPLQLFINWYLPKYTDSLIIFRIIFPGLAISSCVTVIMHNYYKVLGETVLYFKKSVVVLLLSAAANGIAYLLFKTTASISVASIVTMVVWYVYVERLFVREYEVDPRGNMIYMFVMGACFYLVTMIPNVYISFMVYLAVFCLVTFVTKRDVVEEIRKVFARGKRNAG